MKDDSREKRRRVRLPRHLPRLALLVCLALVVVSLGMVFKPEKPQEPQEPPVSERARAAALADALDLLADGEQLGAAPAVPATTAAALPAVTRTVSLLTTQARALLPGQAAATSSPALPSTAAASASAAAAPATVDGLAAGLARSGRQRLADAATADGGMARLLAAVGTGQLLQATSLAAAAGVPDPSAGQPDPGPAGAATAAPSCPAAPSPSAAAGGTGAGNAGLPGALAALIRTELETVYDYQVALTRLDGPAAKSAAEDLARHEALVAGAESLSRSHCAPIPPREPGYALDPVFLASPGPGLAALETAALPAYGDLVAFSDGATRQWAIAGLVGAARRAASWGATTDAVPGLAADPASFPTLPAG